MIVSDSDYLKQLEIIRKIRDTTTTTDEINLPQICVIGDQSSGKSSFLSRLTGISFPTAAKMCTKAATVVTCNRDSTLNEPRYEIEDCEHRGSYKVVTSTAEAIKETQNKMLRKAANEIDWNEDDNQIITDQSIKLRVTSANVIDIIIVDLPGIQHAGSTKESIDFLIEQNIAKPETLILIVSEAKQDAELTKAIEIAAKYDPEHERTIRVLSKFDNFDTPDTQKRAVQLIKEGAYEGNAQAIPYQLNLGPHAVISIGKDGVLRADREGDDAEKKQLVQEYNVSESRAGILPLKERLQPLFANLIRASLPALKQNVSDRLDETQFHLNKVGAHPASPLEILSRCHSLLMSQVDEIEKELTHKCFLPMKSEILSVKKNITFEFATSNFKINSFQCILFQGQSKFNQAAVQIRKLWEPIVNKYIKSTREVMLDAHHCLRNEESTKIYGALISAIDAEYQEYLQAEVFPKFKTACIEALEEERFFGTTNHYFDAKFREDEICPEALIENFVTKAQALWDDADKTVRHKTCSAFRSLSMSHLKDCLVNAKKEVAAHEVHADLMESQKKRVFAAIKAHFDVEKKTFVDNLLKKTKDILMQGHTAWILQYLLRSTSISDAAKEDEYTCKLRKDLVERIERLDDCMSLLSDVPLPTNEPKDDFSSSSAES